MEYKQIPVELKIDDTGTGSMTGYASTFANWDSVKERPVKGAFAPHLADFLKDGFIAVGHNWSALPVATPTEAREDDHGLLLKADFHSTPDAQAARTVTNERLARGKSVKLSIGYEVLNDEYVEEGRLLKEIKLYEVSLVTVPANSMASVTASKGMPLAEQSDAVLAAVEDYIARLKQLHSLRAKEGRVLSGDNRKRIENAVEALAGAQAALSDLLAASDPKPKHNLAAMLAAYQGTMARIDEVLTR
jgi:Escherichia/Staphylococcus phage prohead protease